MEEDWDNVVILDACRYDLFESVNTLDGNLDYRISPASATPEFLSRNFEEKQYHDTVYVTANPMYRTLGLDEVFHQIIDVWENHWDRQKQTVLPEAMTEATASAYKRFPNKRIISHFMQPHYPFVGELASEIGAHSGYEFAYRNVTEGEASRDNPTVWERLEAGDVSRELVWDAYAENLKIVFPHVEELLELFDEKTVITSDHGNLLGEKPHPLAAPVYGHPHGMRHEHLSKVPWLIVAGTERKYIVSEKPIKQLSDPSGDVTDRLADLGYFDV
ncbi:LTA synthase family protein [Salinirubellus salinus]|uniref:LTA synthase family protein n=1 Tax=Salinirubellus salinus TaxID=1364945 RepID=A0A9E7QZ75_9EURY|nr:LTA synthase family protein [Salinirubellus salinus]UWM52746.1 LTA synthase family protein [Salinirubellus salinus]